MWWENQILSETDFKWERVDQAYKRMNGVIYTIGLFPEYEETWKWAFETTYNYVQMYF